jgi:hypothetical protein
MFQDIADRTHADGPQGLRLSPWTKGFLETGALKLDHSDVVSTNSVFHQLSTPVVA